MTRELAAAPGGPKSMVARVALSMLVLWALGAAGCGGRRATRPEEQPVPEQVIEMDGIAVTVVGEKDGDPVVEAIDALTLFETARQHFEEGRYAESEQAYGRLIELFPEGRLVAPALYNRGLAFEELGQYGQAAAHFRRYAQLATTLKDRRDGEFRWGHNLVRTGDYPTAISLYDRLLAAPDLGPADRAEAYLRRGTAYLGLRRFGEAERDLKQSLEQAALAYDGVLDGNELAAEAHFRRGEIYERLFEDVPLRLPVERMESDLADKVKFFRQAQHSFIDALSVRHPYWASAAGLKLGELYEKFYRHILSAEIPPDFDPEMRRLYFQVLKERLRPLLERSLTIYEKNISMSQRIGADNEWTAQTEERLERLRSLLIDSAGPAEADEAEGGAATPDAGPPRDDAPAPDAGPDPPKGDG